MVSRETGSFKEYVVVGQDVCFPLILLFLTVVISYEFRDDTGHGYDLIGARI